MLSRIRSARRCRHHASYSLYRLQCAWQVGLRSGQSRLQGFCISLLLSACHHQLRKAIPAGRPERAFRLFVPAGHCIISAADVNRFVRDILPRLRSCPAPRVIVTKPYLVRGLINVFCFDPLDPALASQSVLHMHSKIFHV